MVKQRTRKIGMATTKNVVRERKNNKTGEAFRDMDLHEQEEIKIFRTQPSVVEIGLSRTVAVAPYESVRVHVQISRPCYREHIKHTTEDVIGEVYAILSQQLTIMIEDSPNWST